MAQRLVFPKSTTIESPRLKHKYPFKDVELDLLQCLDHFWCLNHTDAMSGMPVLVQMEMGKLEGLNKVEFDEFLVRVGLQRDENGSLTFRAPDDLDEASTRDGKM